MQERIGRRGSAGDDMHERICRSDLSCISSPACLLLRLISCISPLACPLLLSNIKFLHFGVAVGRSRLCDSRPSTGIGAFEFHKSRPFAGIGAFEVQKSRPSAGIGAARRLRW